MAIYIQHHDTCFACNGHIPGFADLYKFENFILNERSLFYVFNNNGFHKTCLAKDSDGTKAIELHEKFLYHSRPANRRCTIDGNAVGQKERITMAYVTDDTNSFLYDLSFKNFRISNLKTWSERGKLVSALKELKKKHPHLSQYADDLIEKAGGDTEEKGWFGKLFGK